MKFRDGLFLVIIAICLYGGVQYGLNRIEEQRAKAMITAAVEQEATPTYTPEQIDAWIAVNKKH